MAFKAWPRRRSQRRKGAAVVELAVCLPIIVLLLFASIETCNMIFLRQALNASAYEGIRVAVQSDATNEKVENRSQSVLDARQVKGTNIAFNPNNVSAAKPGDPIEITITAACDVNSVGPSWFFAGRTVAGRASFVKE